ncbi:MAG TPA: gluconate 2-dehydrogenase subunit 3 family protein [Candidatus Dormibacteraeota bacterium]|nr:gluconate 2-dehydrogenase subunit 3 family protein [Candidatus Dormibacteraeota bacterium]
MSEYVDRRHFLRSVAAGGTAAFAAWPVSGMELAAPGVLKFFNKSQALLVGALVEQLVPADDFAGATEAGVVSYIDTVLAGPFGKFYRDVYEAGLQIVEDTSHKQFQQAFVSLLPEQQVVVLKKLESADATESRGSQFFKLLLQHTLEGYYGVVHHSGEKDEHTSWKMLHFEG